MDSPTHILPWNGGVPSGRVENASIRISFRADHENPCDCSAVPRLAVMRASQAASISISTRAGVLCRNVTNEWRVVVFQLRLYVCSREHGCAPLT